MVDLGNFSDGTAAWGYYSQTFTLPVSATGTSFSIRFTTVSTGSGNQSVGNFLDAISIADVAPALNTSSLTIVCPATTVDISSLTATNSPASTTQTYHSGPVAIGANQLASTLVGPGTYYTSFYEGTKGCYGATTAITVGLSGVPAAPTIIRGQPTCTTPTGSITVTAPAGAGLTYSINNITYTSVPSFGGLATGTYSVYARNGGSLCTSTATSAVINAQPTITAAFTNATICVGATASQTATGGSSYRFNTIPTATTNTSGILATSPYATTVYSVTATSAQGCTAVASGTVTVNSVTATLTSATVCNGNNAVLKVTGGISYVFSNGTSNTTGSLVQTPGVNGGYSVTVTSAQGCSAVASGTVTTQVCVSAGCTNALLNPGFESPVISATNGNNVIYSMPGWYTRFASGIGVNRVNGAGYGAGADNAEDGNQYVYINAATSDFLVQNFTLSCASSLNYSGYFSNNSTYAGYAPWTAQITIQNAGSSTVSSSTTKNFTSADADETWYPLTGSSAILPAGDYTFVVKVTGSGNFDAANLCITPCPACTTPAVSSTAITNVCSAGTANLNVITASNTPASTTLTFHSGTPATTVNTVSNVNVSAGTYYAAFYSLAGDCYGPAVAVTVTLIPCLTPDSGTVSAGTGGTAVTNVMANDQVNGQPATLSNATLTSAGAYPTGIGLTPSGSITVAQGTTPGSYTVLYQVCDKLPTPTCATATAVVTVTPSINPAPDSGTICANGTVVANVAANDLVNGQPAVPGTNAILAGVGTYPTGIALNTSTGAVTVAVETPAGSYTVSYQLCDKLAPTTCATAVVAITVNPSVTATLTSATICNGSSTTLTASGGVGYQFTGGVSNTTGLLVVNPTTNGANSYSVTVTSAQGCTAVATAGVLVNPLPQLTVNSATVCAGTAITLTVGGCAGGSVVWSTGDNAASLVVVPVTTATYLATCTFPTGCSAAITTVVTVNAAPAYSVLPTVVPASCTGSTANSDAHVDFTGLQNTARADVSMGSGYTGSGYSAPGSKAVSGGTVSFTGLSNPNSRQVYTIRLFNTGGGCVTDVYVRLDPASCQCPAPNCPPVVSQRIGH